jgi:hypothetical protein
MEKGLVWIEFFVVALWDKKRPPAFYILWWCRYLMLVMFCYAALLSHNTTMAGCFL